MCSPRMPSLQINVHSFPPQSARANFAVEAARAMANDPTLDLARAALEIAAEDDALVSHSVVPLPVDSYISRLDLMAAEVANHHLPARLADRTPRIVFDALNKYLYKYQVSWYGHLCPDPHQRLNTYLIEHFDCFMMLCRGIKVVRTSSYTANIYAKAEV